MRNLILFFALFSLAINLCAQNFEGKIVYKNTYTSKILTIPDQQLNVMLGTVTEYYIKGGNYKTISNGTFLQWQLYVNKDNKLYNKFSMAETLMWNDCTTNPSEVIKTEIKKNVTKILGYQCDEITMTCASGTQKYYYNSKLKVDAKAFAKHNFYNLNKYLALAHAVPLKTIIEIDQFTLENEATEIKEMKLDDKFFELPPDAETAPSPY